MLFHAEPDDLASQTLTDADEPNYRDNTYDVEDIVTKRKGLDEDASRHNVPTVPGRESPFDGRWKVIVVLGGSFLPTISSKCANQQEAAMLSDYMNGFTKVNQRENKTKKDEHRENKKRYPPTNPRTLPNHSNRGNSNMGDSDIQDSDIKEKNDPKKDNKTQNKTQTL